MQLTTLKKRGEIGDLIIIHKLTNKLEATNIKLAYYNKKINTQATHKHIITHTHTHIHTTTLT